MAAGGWNVACVEHLDGYLSDEISDFSGRLQRTIARNGLMKATQRIRMSPCGAIIGVQIDSSPSRSEVNRSEWTGIVLSGWGYLREVA